MLVKSLSLLSERIESENENNVIEGINRMLGHASEKGTNIYINLLESKIASSEGSQKEKYIKTLNSIKNYSAQAQ